MSSALVAAVTASAPFCVWSGRTAGVLVRGWSIGSGIRACLFVIVEVGLTRPGAPTQQHGLLVGRRSLDDQGRPAGGDDLIREFWDGGNGLSYRQIAARLDVKTSMVQAVFRGKGSGTTRPRVNESEEQA
ncbi:hypothetical protein ACFXAZ_02015 [Streptomyces sp. NPDC059477]|uniref:hypothetical protein n=1 Tax=Streptomyces sp. NPDC059477 TaxID=3346847 RepID=UPI003689245A